MMFRFINLIHRNNNEPALELYAAPTELTGILHNVLYKYAAPLALSNKYSPNCIAFSKSSPEIVP